MIISVMRYFKYKHFKLLEKTAVCTSRGKLIEVVCPSNKVIIPRAQMYVTDNVGRRDQRGTIRELFEHGVHTFIYHTQRIFIDAVHLKAGWEDAACSGGSGPTELKFQS